MAHSRLLVCLMLVAASTAVPVTWDDLDTSWDLWDESPSTFNTNQCAKQCSGSTSKFRYQPGTTYVYRYEAQAVTTVAGAAQNEARMNIETVANIEVISQCEFALTLQDVKLYHSQPHSDNMKPAENLHEFQQALTQNNLRFSFDDGIIRDVCHADQEKIWVLNFKKGLLSSFQNSMDDLNKDQQVKEVDVTGECQAVYTKKSEWIWQTSIKLSKTKDLMSCFHHSGMRTVIPMVPYQVPSAIQNIPIIKSDHQCDFIVTSSRHLESAICSESHVFAPFSNHQSGGSTKVKQTLTFVTIKPGIQTRQETISVRSNLLYRHMNGIDKIPNNKQVAEQKLKEICEQTQYDVRPETPRLFNEIAQSVKDMEASDLKDLYDMIKDKTLCRQSDKAMKFFKDSLPVAGTKGALDIMVNIINNDEVPDIEKRVWLTSLSLMPEPTEDMLPSIKTLLSGNYADQAMLPVSALLRTMCQKNVDCENSYQFNEIADKLTQNIGYSCNSDNRPQLLETLRAIGNIGCGTKFLRTIKTCLTSRYAPLEIKVAATDAYRRFQCQENEENGALMEILESRTAESELRMMSFLSLMRCPRESVLQKIADVLEREEDIQVGTFIYTHLESIKQTSDPHKQNLAQAIKRLSLRAFEDGGLKTSRSHEWSALINRFNLGYVANGDLIWSETSTVPRSARVNLTLEMFGNSINLFEAGARVEGMEGFVQKYFGPQGYFSQDKSSMSQDLEAFVYARVFGNELMFKHIKGQQEYDRVNNNINFDKLLDSLSKKYDFKYTHSQVLMDQSVIIPTAIGLPVNMTLNSTATVSTETKGEIDFSGILSRSSPISVTSNMAASAGLEVTGSMMVDAMIYKQGVRMRNTLHSSINLNANLKVTKRQMIDFEIESPEKKQEIFDAESQFFIVHDYLEEKQDMIKNNRKEMKGCTGEKFTKATGFQLCGDISYPNASLVPAAPYFPLTGPVKVKVFMNKMDTQRSYKIFAKWLRSSKKLEAQLQLDTPGSKVDRHISADLTVGTHKTPHVDLVLISPWKKIVVNTKGAQNKDIASLTGNVMLDDNLQYKLTSQVKVERVAGGEKFLPFVEIENGQERITLLKGSVVYTKNLQAQFEVQDLSKRVFTIGGQVSNNDEEKRVDVSVGMKDERPYHVRLGSMYKRSGRQGKTVQLDPEIVIESPQGQIISWKSYGEYQPKPTKLSGSMTFDTNLVKMQQPLAIKVDVSQKRQSYPITVEVKSPLISAGLKGSADIGKKNHKAEMRAVYRIGSVRDTITFAGRMQDKSKTHYGHYKMKSTLKFKKMSEYNTLSSLEIAHKKKYTAKLNVQFTEKPKSTRRQADIQAVGSFLADVEHLMKAQIEADLQAKMPEKDIDINMKLDHRHSSKKLESEVKLHLSPFVESDINADLRVQDKGRNLFDITAQGNLQAMGKTYSLKSELVQKSKKRFEHSISLENDQQGKHSMRTVYKATNDRHEIQADFKSTQLDQPLNLLVSADLKKPTDFHVRGTINENNKELYSVDALSKLEGKKAGKWNVEVAYPRRKVKAQVDMTKANNRINADILVNWDVNSPQQPTPEVRLNSQFTHVSDSDSVLVKANIKVQTPFDGYRKLTSNWNLEKSQSDFKSTGKITFDDNKKQISSKLTSKLPMSLEKAKATLQVKTPFEDYKELDVQLDHSFDSQIKSQLKVKLNDDRSEMQIKGTKDIVGSTRRIQGQIFVKTPYESFKRAAIQVQHSDDDKEIKTSAKINKDGKKYDVSIQYSKDAQSRNTQRNFQLVLSGPQKSIKSQITQKYQDGEYQIEAHIDNDQCKCSMDVTASFRDIAHNSLNVDIKSPLKKAKHLALQMEQGIDKDQLKSKVVLEFSDLRFGYDIALKNTQEEKSIETILYGGPFIVNDHPLQFKSIVQNGDYPVTISGQISWDPTSPIDFTVSYKMQNIDDMDFSLILKTPFQQFEHINIVASNVIRRSVRVSHVNVEYDSKKMVDVEVKTQNGDDRKSLRIKMSVPKYGLENLDTGLNIALKDGIFTKAHAELILKPGERFQGVFSVKIDEDKNVRGKIMISTPFDGLEKLEGSLVREGRQGGNEISLTLTNGNDQLIDIDADSAIERDAVLVRVTTKGKLLFYVLQAVDKLQIFPRIHKDRDGNEIQTLTVKVSQKDEEKTMWLDGEMIADYGRNKDKTNAEIRVTGESIQEIDIKVSLTHNGRTLQGDLVLKLKDGVHIRGIVTDIFGNKHGIEYIYSGDSYKTEYKASVYAQEFRRFESSLELMVSSIQRIEFASTTKTDVRGYELTKLKYTHEGQDNRISCSSSIEDVKGIKASIDLVVQVSPIHLASLIVKTPFRKCKNLIISGDYDQTKINGLLELNGDKKISLSGVHNNFKNPKFTLKTPLRLMKILSVNVDGVLTDFSSSVTLQFNDNDQMDGKMTFKYSSPSQMLMDAQGKSIIDSSENKIKMKLDTTQQPKRSRVLISFNDEDEIKFLYEYDSRNDKSDLDFEVKYPSLGIQTRGLVLNLNGNGQKWNGKIQLLGLNGKVVDADVAIDMKDEMKASLIVRQPKHMEYTFTREHFSESNQNTLSFNWDRNDPDANLVIKATYKDDSTSYKMDRSVSLRLACPKRSVGLEHFMVASRKHVESSGKFYWNDDRSSQVAYQLNVKDESTRRQSAYDGNLKIELPTRTLGIAGNTRDQSGEREIQTAFSWDLDNDVSKKVGVKVKFQKGSHTQADVSLILPKEAHVDSKLVMNKGNTILEGQTQIYYSDDVTKTLTLFSKLENNPGPKGFFYSSVEDRYNYSIQLGMSHPDSNIDVKMTSHMGVDSDRLTSSVGVAYLTAKKASKNTALFLEINKLKKEINLYASTPYKTISMSGAIKNDPIEMTLTSHLDNKKAMDARLILDTREKKAQFDYSINNKNLQYSAQFPKQTALLIQRQRQENGQTEQDVKILLELVTPYRLQTDLQWKPGMLTSLRDRIFQIVKTNINGFKELSQEIARDLKTEVSAKYDDVSKSLIDDAIYMLLSLEEGLADIQKDLNQIPRSLSGDFDICDVIVGDFKLNEEMSRLQENMKESTDKLIQVIKSYTQSQRDSLKSLSEKLKELKAIPGDVVYTVLVQEIGRLEHRLFNSFFWDLMRFLHDLSPEVLEDLWKVLRDLVERQYNPKAIIDELNKGMEEFTEANLSNLFDKMTQRKLKVAAKLKVILRDLGQFVSSHPLTQHVVKILEENANEFYQVARWSISYLEIDTSLPDHVDHLVGYINDILKESLEEQLGGSVGRYLHNPVTRFDPQQGILQAEIPLMIPVERLDQIPSVRQITKGVAKYIKQEYSTNSSIPPAPGRRPTEDLDGGDDDYYHFNNDIRQRVTKGPNYGVLPF